MSAVDISEITDALTTVFQVGSAALTIYILIESWHWVRGVIGGAADMRRMYAENYQEYSEQSAQFERESLAADFAYQANYLSELGSRLEQENHDRDYENWEVAKSVNP